GPRSCMQVETKRCFVHRTPRRETSSVPQRPNCEPPRLRCPSPVGLCTTSLAKSSKIECSNPQISSTSPPRKKYLPFFRKSWLTPAIPRPLGGRLAIVTDVGSEMRWTRWARKTNAPVADGEAVQSRSPDTLPRRWGQVRG